MPGGGRDGVINVQCGDNNNSTKVTVEVASRNGDGTDDAPKKGDLMT